MGKKGGNRGVRIKQVGPKAPKGLLNPMDALAIPPEEMIHLPPPPDRSYQIFWPIHETFGMDPTNFLIIYPSYLDSTKSIPQGRRISKANAVDTPTVADISQALQQMGIRHVIQPYKGYSRDITTIWDNPGRVKVDPAKLDDLTIASGMEQKTQNPKKCLLLELAQRIPTLSSRIQRLEQEQAQREKEQNELEAQQEAAKKEKERAAAAAAAAQKQSSTKSAKKRGKKKR